MKSFSHEDGDWRRRDGGTDVSSTDKVDWKGTWKIVLFI
jgi:hypothetical protein